MLIVNIPYTPDDCPVSKNLKPTHASDFPFSALLPEEWIEEACKDMAYRKRVFTPAMTVYTFLMQVSAADQSCQNAVSKVLAHFVQTNESKKLSANTSAYCQARERLPENVLSTLTKKVALDLEDKAEDNWKWRGRSVKLIDGTTLSMPDTEANQKSYPQSSNQKKGSVFH